MKTQLANLFTQKTNRQNVPVAMAPESGGGGGPHAPVAMAPESGGGGGPH